MIGVYAFVQGAPQFPELRALQLGEMILLIGPQHPELSVEALKAYEAQVRAIAGQCQACLPARFGAEAESEDALLQSVEPKLGEYLEALALVKGREQMTLRIYGSAEAPKSGTEYLQQKRIPALDPVRAFVKAERIEHHDQPGFLASAYHLIDRGTEAAYRSALDRIDGLRIIATGPWPAWAFAP
jgi:hypothetical protein